jgi:hypothetical protein
MMRKPVILSPMAISSLQTAEGALREMASDEGLSAEEKATLDRLARRMEKSLRPSVPKDATD